MHLINLSKIVSEGATKTIAPASSNAKSIGQLILVIVIFLLVLAATFFVTKWIGGYQKTKTANGNLQILEAVRLPSNKYIELVRVGKDKYIVVGVGKDEINVLTTLEAEELLATTDTSGQPMMPKKTFSQILNGFKDSLPKQK